ncbi:TPA: putative lipid II flippase FtsW [Candidatus Poribacteria bacterium]|nr:putative lipid II flippase FtsW [Candidatus Poribacteria bacterium]
MLNEQIENEFGSYDRYILGAIGFLLVIGILMVYSASNAFSRDQQGDSLFYLKRQLFSCCLGLGLMLIAMLIDYRHYQRLMWLLIIVSFALLLAVFIPGVGLKVGGSTRWIKIWKFTFQPVEFAKLALIIYIARFLDKRSEYMGEFKKGVLPPLIVFSVFFTLLAIQPDFGSIVLLVALAFLMLFVGGAKIYHLLILISSAFIGLIIGIIVEPYRLNRVKIFLNPWRDPEGDGYQAVHSLYSLGSGKIFGRGVGGGVEKLYYLPTPHTDSIFAVIGEELGFVGAVFVIMLFMIIVWRGKQISDSTDDRFGKLLAVGISCLIGVQAIINIGVATSSLPAKGITLPFISFGGSSLVISLISVGILLNISKNKMQG